MPPMHSLRGYITPLFVDTATFRYYAGDISINEGVAVDFMNASKIAQKIALALVLSSSVLAVLDLSTAGYAQEIRNRGEREGGETE
jgi:hypothetical protein